MARLSAAIIVDSDPKGLEALAYGFVGEGCRVATSDNYLKADALVEPTGAGLVVLAVRDPSAALDLARRLQARDTGSSVAVLALGPGGGHEPLRAAGVDYLPLPAFVRDVVTASRILVAVQEARERGSEELDVQGALSDYGLFYLVRTMIGLGRSGIIQVERSSRRGEIRFIDGEVTAAEVGSLQGSAALHHLLLWEEAALDIKLRPLVRRGSFRKRAEELLEEAERFLRDVAHATKDIGPTRSIFAADAEKVKLAGDSLPGEVAPVVQLFDGQRSLGDVIEDSPFRVFETLRITSKLLDLGILTRVPVAADAAPSGAVKRPLAEWLGSESAARVEPTTSPTASGPVSPVTEPENARDQRSGTLNRRKGRRDQRPSDEQRRLSTTAKDPPSAAAPPATPAGSASGGIQARGELRASRRQAPTVGQAPSFVVDFGDGAESAPPAQAEPPPTSQSVQSTGTVEVPPSLRNGAGRSSGSRAVSPPSSTGTSIELDPGLMADLAALEGASPTPPPSPIAPAPAAAPAAAPRGAATAPPSHPVAPAASAAPSPLPTGPAAATPASPAPKAPPSSPDIKRGVSRRPSAEFNALEADFFARESDLYQNEAHETFDDLDPAQRRR